MKWRFPDLKWLKNAIAGQNVVVYIIWVILLGALLLSIVTLQWSLTFFAAQTLVFSLAPAIFSERFNVKLPIFFFTFVVVFLFATTFLGEQFDFYERFWWWDLVLHGSSAVGFGLIGVIYVLMLFQGDRYAAPPLALAVIAFCFAITIGVGWEIYEFGMDLLFGLNMQKSGLIDTMTDMIINAVGASVGAAAGYRYLTGRSFGGLSGLIDEFVRQNRRYFRKSNGGDKKPKD